MSNFCLGFGDANESSVGNNIIGHSMYGINKFSAYGTCKMQSIYSFRAEYSASNGPVSFKYNRKKSELHVTVNPQSILNNDYARIAYADMDFDNMHGYLERKLSRHHMLPESKISEWTVTMLNTFVDYDLPSSVNVNNFVQSMRYHRYPHLGTPGIRMDEFQSTSIFYPNTLHDSDSIPNNSIYVWNYGQIQRNIGRGFDHNTVRFDIMSSKRNQLDCFVDGTLVVRSLQDDMVIERFTESRMKHFTKLRFMGGSSAGTFLSKSGHANRVGLAIFARQFSYETSDSIQSYIGDDKFEDYTATIDSMDIAIIPESDETIGHSKMVAIDDNDEIIEQKLLREKVYLTRTEAAKYLGLSKSSIYKLVNEGAIPFCKILGVIPRNELDRMIEAKLLNRLSDGI